MNSTLIRTIFAQPDRESAVGQLRDVVDQLTRITPTVAERLNRELKGCTDVVQIVPNTEFVIRLVGAYWSR